MNKLRFVRVNFIISLEKLYFCGSLGVIMNNEMSVREMLEWYLAAGVDETLGEVPFGIAEEEPVIRRRRMPAAMPGIYA